MSVIPYAVVCFRTVTDTMRVISATQGSKEFEATHQQRWSRNITGVTARYNAWRWRQRQRQPESLHRVNL